MKNPRLLPALLLSAGLALASCARAQSALPDSDIKINGFLWRAGLETLSFLPLRQVDPFGGVIISDWRADTNKPDERFRVTIYILDTRLRADALRVAVFRQARTPSGGWQDAEAHPDLPRALENLILARARALRLARVHATGG